MTNDQSDIPPCLIYIDKEGHWYHKGTEMIRRDFIRRFYQNMELDSEGQYMISWNGKRCYVEVEDTAFVVRKVTCKDKNQVQNAIHILSLSDDTNEELLPDTLCLGKDNVLYCQVKNRTFPARFGRAAYYQLAEYIQEENDVYYLPFKGQRYKILT